MPLYGGSHESVSSFSNQPLKEARILLDALEGNRPLAPHMKGGSLPDNDDPPRKTRVGEYLGEEFVTIWNAYKGYDTKVEVCLRYGQ